MANMSWDQMRDEAEKTGGFAPHPIGKFKFKVIEASLKKGSTGNGQIFARMENVDVGPNQGKTVVNTMSPLKNDGTTNGMFFQQLGALGFTADHPLYAALSSMDNDQGLGYIATSIIGAEAMCEITHREWANETRDNIKKMTPVDTGVVVPGAAPVATAPAPAVVPQPPAAPAAPAAVPVPVAPAPVPVAPAPVQVPVAPTPEPVPVATVTDNTVQQVPAGVQPAAVPTPPVAAVGIEPVAVQPATEPVAVPTTVEAVVAQIPSPVPVAIPTPPEGPF